MLSFEKFVSSFPINAVVRNNPVAQYIYEKIIWREDVRIKLADASDVNVPALSVCVKEIENYCEEHSELDLKSNPVKQTIGRMVASAMEPLGYMPARRTRIPLNTNSKFFSSAHIYEYIGNETERIERRIINITNMERGVENEKV